MIRRAARATLFPYATLFRPLGVAADRVQAAQTLEIAGELAVPMRDVGGVEQMLGPDIVDGLGEQRLSARKSTRLNSSHREISHPPFCLRQTPAVDASPATAT